MTPPERIGRRIPTGGLSGGRKSRGDSSGFPFHLVFFPAAFTRVLRSLRITGLARSDTLSPTRFWKVPRRAARKGDVMSFDKRQMIEQLRFEIQMIEKGG